MINKKQVIYIAGDSTAETKKPEDKPMSGWGEYLQDYLNSSVAVDNHAMGGRSTKSFLDEKRLDAIINQIKEDDYLLIQFGHNDQKIEDPTRYTDAFGTYQENLRLYINKVREKKAHPILVSSISRRAYKDGKIDRESLGDYPAAMKEVAKKEDVFYIEGTHLSADYLDELGIEQSKDLFLHLAPNTYPNYPEGLVDNTHFSEKGGKIFAEIIGKELKSKLEER